MAVGKLGSRTSLRDVVTGHVAVVRRRLAEVVGRAADPCMAPGSWHSGSAVMFTEVRYVGQPITGPRLMTAGNSQGALTLYTTEEAAEILRVKKSWLERQAAARKIPFTMLGRSYRFTSAHLSAIVRMHEQAPARRGGKATAIPVLGDSAQNHA